MRPLTAGLLAVLLAACSTRYSVRRVDPDSPVSKQPAGIRYSLPIPVVATKFDPSTGMSLSYEMIADEDNTYAIDAEAFMSAYELGLEVNDRGLLKAATFMSSSAGPAAAGVGFAKGVIDERLKEEAERKSASKQKRDDEQQELETLRTTIKGKEDQVRLQKDYVEDLIRLGAPQDSIFSARLDLAKLENELTLLKEQLTDRTTLHTGDLKSLSTSSQPGLPAPAFYRIEETLDERGHATAVRLVAVKWKKKPEADAQHQPTFPSTTVPTASVPIVDPGISLTTDPVLAPVVDGYVQFAPTNERVKSLKEREQRMLARLQKLRELKATAVDSALVSQTIFDISDAERDRTDLEKRLAAHYSRGKLTVEFSTGFIPKSVKAGWGEKTSIPVTEFPPAKIQLDLTMLPPDRYDVTIVFNVEEGAKGIRRATLPVHKHAAPK